MFRSFALFACVFVSLPALQAHPGHGSPAAPDGLMHLLTSPIHLLPAMAVVAGVLLAAVGVRRIISRGRRRTARQESQTQR